MGLVKKALFRLFRTLTFRKGVYCKYGKKTKFCRNLFIDEETFIGSYSYIGKFSTITKSRIGNYCSIAEFVTIGPGEHPLNEFSTSCAALKAACIKFDLTSDEVNIGNDVWIGTNAVILRGVNIGDGAVVAAGSIVTKNVPAYAIVAGVPARIIRYRLDEEKSSFLASIKWWESSQKEISSVLASYLGKEKKK